jgi:hypothetical protein
MEMGGCEGWCELTYPGRSDSEQCEKKSSHFLNDVFFLRVGLRFLFSMLVVLLTHTAKRATRSLRMEFRECSHKSGSCAANAVTVGLRNFSYGFAIRAAVILLKSSLSRRIPKPEMTVTGLLTSYPFRFGVFLGSTLRISLFVVRSDSVPRQLHVCLQSASLLPSQSTSRFAVL